MNSFSYLEPVCCFVSSSNCCFLTCLQVSQEAGQMVWYSHLFQKFPQFTVIHTVKGFGIVNPGVNGNPLQYSYLGNPMNRGAWWATVHGVTESEMTERLTHRWRMVTHSSILAWEIPWTEEPGGLQSIRSWRVGHDWMTILSLSHMLNIIVCA